MINVGDLHSFARAIGKWLYSVNPDLDTEKLNTAILQFARSAPIIGEDGSTLNIEEFCQEAAKGYTSEEETPK